MMEEEILRDPGEETAEETAGGKATGKDRFAKKFHEARNACGNACARVRKDLRETGWNPYIRATKTYRYDFYRSEKDSEPVDSMVLERSGGCTLRTLLLTAGILVAALTVGHCLKK